MFIMRHLPKEVKTNVDISFSLSPSVPSNLFDFKRREMEMGGDREIRLPPDIQKWMTALIGERVSRFQCFFRWLPLTTEIQDCSWLCDLGKAYLMVLFTQVCVTVILIPEATTSSSQFQHLPKVGFFSCDTSSHLSFLLCTSG